MLFRVHLLDKGKETTLTDGEFDSLLDHLQRGNSFSQECKATGFNISTVEEDFDLIEFHGFLFLHIDFFPAGIGKEERIMKKINKEIAFLTSPEFNKLCHLDDLGHKWFYDNDMDVYEPGKGESSRTLEFYCTVFPLSTKLGGELLRQTIGKSGRFPPLFFENCL